MVILDCGNMFMTGKPNPDNVLGRNDFKEEHQLRYQEKYNKEMNHILKNGVVDLYNNKVE